MLSSVFKKDCESNEVIIFKILTQCLTRKNYRPLLEYDGSLKGKRRNN